MISLHMLFALIPLYKSSEEPFSDTVMRLRRMTFQEWSRGKLSDSPVLLSILVFVQ
jgi:hypothetical protein